MSVKPLIAPPTRRLPTQQALNRAAGAPLIAGNAVELLIDAAANYAAWLAAIRGAAQRVLLENYIIRDDVIGREFRAALIERAQAGVTVAVITDWAGCLGSPAAHSGRLCARRAAASAYSTRRSWACRLAG